MSIRWTNGGPIALIGRLKSQDNLLRARAFDVVRDVASEASRKQIEYLNKAVTPTGEARMAAGIGGSAGRNKTGHMIDGISTEFDVEGNTAKGAWGWDNFEPYFDAQDNGTSRIEAADSLFGSFIWASKELKSRIKRLRKGR